MNKRELLSRKKAYAFFDIVGFFFVFFWKTEKDLAGEGNLLWTGSYTVKVLAVSLVLGVLLGSAVCFICYGLAEGKWSRRQQGAFLKNAAWAEKGKVPLRQAGVWLEGLGCGWVYLASFLLMILSWMPAYLAYYPAVCAYDSPVQVGQAVENYLFDQHPIVHTLMIKGAINLGKNVFGSVNTGVGIYTILQMVFLAAAFAYGIAALHRCRVRILWQVLMLLYCMIYPFHMYMSVSMTKDTIFSAFFVFLMVSFCRILRENKNEMRYDRTDFLLFLSVIGMMLFRTNGRYAMIVLLVFSVLVILLGRENRKFWKRLFLNMAAAFLAGNLALSAVFNLSGAEQGDRREMLSMPIQQLARCMIYHGGVGVMAEDDNTMDEADKALINDFLLNESYKDYDPSLADPVKRHTNTYVVRYRPKDFLNSYFRLLLRYPGDFINAGLAVNAGYFYPDDVSHAYINVEEGLTGRGYVQTYWFEEDLNPRGLYKDSKWESLHAKLETWADSNAYLHIPVLKYIFVPGTYLWFYLIFAGYLLICRRYRMLLPLSLVLGYYITLFLGPTVQLRYIYPLMIVLPFMVLLNGSVRQCVPEN